MPISGPRERSTQRALTCTPCGRKFTRPSHLSRHRLTHLPLARKNLTRCFQCGSSFSRNDVLLRHLRSAHQVDLSSKRSAQRSCFRCVSKKLKCDRAEVCQTCSGAQAECIYPSLNGSSDDRLAPSNTPRRTSSAATTEQEQYCERSPSPYPDFTTSHSALGPPALNTPDSTIEGSSSSPPSSRDGRLNGNPSDFAAGIPCDYSTLDEPFGVLLPSADEYFDPSSCSLMSSLAAPSHLDFRTTSFDWLDFDVPDLAVEDANLLTTNDVLQVWPTRPSQRHALAKTGQLSTTNLSSDTLGISRTARNSPLLRALEPQKVVQPWPFDQAQDSIPHRYLLPPLRDVLQTTCRTSAWERSTTLQSLVLLFSEAQLPDANQPHENNMTHAISLLQRLLDIYFTRFHNIQPIIHISTWKMSACPTVLLAAMACVGALLSDDAQDYGLSWSLSEICLPMITWLGASNSTNYRDISYLNALCLHQIYSLGSGNRQLYQNADRSRGTLIGSLRGMGLLSSRWGAGEDDGQDAKPLSSANSATLNAEWLAWTSREQERRTAWASFEYDCSLCTLTSRRGAVDLSELPRTLPCAESLWDAPSAQVWLALRSRSTPYAFKPPLYSAISTVLAGKDVPKCLGTWAKRLCAQVIGRLLWDLKQIEVLAMPEHFGLSSLSTAHQHSKTSLLAALDTLLGSVDAPTSTAELISYNITGLLCHYSHLYAAEDVMDIVVYIVRYVVSRGSKQGKDLEIAKQRLRSSFARDLPKARRLVWHAAQIVAIANEYLVSAPCEIMRVFMGYIYIIAFAEYCPRSHLAAGQTPSVRLDLPNHQPSQKRSTTEWIQHGGPASLGSVVNICEDGCVPAISQDAQSILQQLSRWGLAEKFSKILQTLECTGF